MKIRGSGVGVGVVVSAAMVDLLVSLSTRDIFVVVAAVVAMTDFYSAAAAAKAAPHPP